jgi:hypothetical protein
MKKKRKQKIEFSRHAVPGGGNRRRCRKLKLGGSPLLEWR